MDLYGELAWRGLVYDATEGLSDALARETLTLYSGFDPTASSLHVGHLLPIMTLARAQRCGHAPIALVGGGTGLIGDPSFKATERALLTEAQVNENVEAIRPQLARFLDFERSDAPARVLNNAEWLARMGAIEFMREVGKHFTVNAMLAKEAVRRRLESADGISYTEFSYPLLQSFDYLTLFDRFHCTLQIGGSDQWGNITAGMDLVRRLRGAKTHGLVMPLLMTSSGTKFGKTEAGAVWLSPALTSPYAFYQFWLNTDDQDAGKYLRFFTFLDAARIRELEAISTREPERRHAQRELAREVTRLVHGDAAVRDAETAAEALFAQDVSRLSVEQLKQAYANVQSTTVPNRAEGWRVVTLLTQTGLAKSNSEAMRLIRGGGIYVNDQRVTDEQKTLVRDDSIGGEMFVIRKGKKDNALIRIVGEVDSRGDTA
jgi:tyrosyl-tRNA synthetase